MKAMRAWLLLLCLVLSHFAQQGADGKRFDPSMVDPLMRRSSLDKNFMRFGRSSPSYTEDEEIESGPGSTSDVETSTEDGFVRVDKARSGNFMRFGRGKQDNFMRFGKALNDNFMRFGRGKQDNYMRFGRGKQDNYMRFGRGKQDNFMRFGRGKQDNFMRFGRGKQDNFMRFGRGKQDNFMRFGRGKQDNFMRFGRDFEGLQGNIPDPNDAPRDTEDNIIRLSRGKQDNFMRFGKSINPYPDDFIPIAMRSVTPKGNSNFIRFGRARPDNFMRFGKSEIDKDSQQCSEDIETMKVKPKDVSEYPDPSIEGFTREVKSKDLNLVRFGRHPPNKNDGFMRFGRNLSDQQGENPQDTILIPQRLKRSLLETYDHQNKIPPTKFQEEVDDTITLPFSSLPYDLQEEYATPVQQDDYTNRRKRSLSMEPTTPAPIAEEDTSVDYITAKLRFKTPSVAEYRSSLISAGLPNVIVGPEFSLLPDLDPPSTMLKRGRPGDQNFLRLG